MCGPRSVRHTSSKRVTPSQPPLVLLHTMSFSSTVWVRNLAALSQRHRVLAIDTIGDLNLSRSERTVKGRDDYVAWFAEVLEGLDISKTAIAGNSYGGWLAANIALLRPELVSSLVLISPPLVFTKYRPAFYKQIMSAVFVRSEPKAERFARWFVSEGTFADESARMWLEQFSVGMPFFRGMNSFPRPKAFTRSGAALHHRARVAHRRRERAHTRPEGIDRAGDRIAAVGRDGAAAGDEARRRAGATRAGQPAHPRPRSGPGLISSRFDWRVASVVALDDAHDRIGDGFDGVGRIAQHVAVIDLTAHELVVHLAGCRLVAKAVALSRRHAPHTLVDRRHQHHVVHRLETGRAHEQREELRPDDTVEQVVYPPRAYWPAAAAAASVITSFWASDSGSHGMMAPLATKVKKVSPVTITLRSNRPATTCATVDFPAPGGPVTTMRSVMPANLEPSRRPGSAISALRVCGSGASARSVAATRTGRHA